MECLQVLTQDDVKSAGVPMSIRLIAAGSAWQRIVSRVPNAIDSSVEWYGESIPVSFCGTDILKTPAGLPNDFRVELPHILDIRNAPLRGFASIPDEDYQIAFVDGAVDVVRLDVGNNAKFVLANVALIGSAPSVPSSRCPCGRTAAPPTLQRNSFQSESYQSSLYLRPSMNLLFTCTSTDFLSETAGLGIPAIVFHYILFRCPAIGGDSPVEFCP